MKTMEHGLKRASTAFRFCSRLSLPVLTGLKARNLKDLSDILKDSPDPVVYEHTHRFLQQFNFLTPQPANDFAVWVTEVLQEFHLGERLAAIDTVRFSALSELRAALVEVIEAHMRANPELRTVPEERAFHFMRSVRYSLPTTHVAWDLREFAGGLRQVSVSSLYLHIFEARLRPPLGLNDFSNWLQTELGEKDLAQRLNVMDPYTQTLEGLRKRILELVERRLEEVSHAAP